MNPTLPIFTSHSLATFWTMTPSLNGATSLFAEWVGWTCQVVLKA